MPATTDTDALDRIAAVLGMDGFEPGDLVAKVALLKARLDYTPEHLPEVVENMTLLPGWRAYLRRGYDPDGSGGLTLWIMSDTEDSLSPGERIQVHHPFLVPHASYKRDVWAAWCFERFVAVLRHEAGEFFQIDGVREFAPHHGNGEDPYITWHVSDYATAAKSAGED